MLIPPSYIPTLTPSHIHPGPHIHIHTLTCTHTCTPSPGLTLVHPCTPTPSHPSPPSYSHTLTLAHKATPTFPWEWECTQMHACTHAHTYPPIYAILKGDARHRPPITSASIISTSLPDTPIPPRQLTTPTHSHAPLPQQIIEVDQTTLPLYTLSPFPYLVTGSAVCEKRSGQSLREDGAGGKTLKQQYYAYHINLWKIKALGHGIRPNCCTVPHKLILRTVCKYIDNMYE